MRKLILFLLVALIFIPGVVIGTNTFKYYIPIKVTNNSTSNITNISAILSINNTQMVSKGYISSSGLDTDVIVNGVETPSMLAGDKLAFFIDSLTPTSNKTFNYRLGVDPARESMPVIAGYGGNVTIDDDEDLELGNNFTIYLDCFVDSSYNHYLLLKEDAFAIYVWDGDVVAEVLGFNITATSSGVTTGEHLVKVWADEEYLYIKVS
jgi:hypothetical protein